MPHPRTTPPSTDLPSARFASSALAPRDSLPSIVKTLAATVQR